MKIKALLPWQLKIVAKMILSRVPISFSIWQKAGLFRHGAMDRTDYAIKNFKELMRIEYDTGAKLAGKTVMEIGPGDSIATAVIAHSLGMKSILIDVDSFATKDISFYQELCAELRRINLRPPILNVDDDLEKILTKCNSRYLTSGLESLLTVESESIDFVISQAVLEHIRKSEFATFVHHLFVVMKRGGIGAHQIDLKDHLDKALNNLRFPEWLWESSFVTRSGFYTNRLRHLEICELFKDVGFKIRETDTQKWDEMPTPVRKLDPAFKYMDIQELLISDFLLLASKP